MKGALSGALLATLIVAGAAHAITTQRVVFIGDSLTANLGLYAHEQLPDRVARTLGPHILAQSIAAPGATMAPFGPFLLGFATQTSLIDVVGGVFPPIAVVILLGSNDYGINNMGVSADVFGTAYTTFLASVQRNHIPAVCITPPWRSDESVPNAAGNTLEDFRTVVRQVCASETIVEGVNAIPHDPAFFLDGVHPNNRGTVLLARAVVAALKPLVVAALTPPTAQ